MLNWKVYTFNIATIDSKYAVIACKVQCKFLLHINWYASWKKNIGYVYFLTNSFVDDYVTEKYVAIVLSVITCGTSIVNKIIVNKVIRNTLVFGFRYGHIPVRDDIL